LSSGFSPVPDEPSGSGSQSRLEIASDNSPVLRGIDTVARHRRRVLGAEDSMADYDVRTLGPNDFDRVMALEQSLFGDKGEKTLGPFYVRLCCDFFNDTCFLAFADGEPVGYMLSFVRGREAYCSTLAIAAAHQRTRLVYRFVQAFVAAIASRVDAVWFTVHEANADARALHATLGARETGRRDAYYGPDEPRIVSRIDRVAFDKLRARMHRLGLLGPAAVA
jgi:ribosomal protein S18 acetylase RimI-like enzyme